MSIDNSKWNERSANSTIKRDGSNGGIEKGRRRKIAPLLSGFRKSRGEIKSSCRACNKLFLIKQFFSFCLSNGYSLERFPYTNKKFAAFFFFSFQRDAANERFRPLWKRCQMSAEEKGTGEGETGWVFSPFCEGQSKEIELLRVTCHTLDELHLIK